MKDEANENFPFLFFTFLLLLPQEIVLEQEHTMADEEHFFLPTSQSEYACDIDPRRGRQSPLSCGAVVEALPGKENWEAGKGRGRGGKRENG